MNQEEWKAAVKWWAERFVPSVTSQHFVMLRNGWTEEELGVQDMKLRWRIDKHERYHIQFSTTPAGLLVLPASEKAQWALGIIQVSNRHYLYTTHWYEDELHRSVPDSVAKGENQ